MATAVLPVTGDPEADELLVSDPFALLVGMLLDQQVPMEWAFRGPATLRDRLGTLDAKRIAAMSPDEVDAVFRAEARAPSLPGFDGEAHARARDAHRRSVRRRRRRDLDATCNDPKELFDRLRALPGFGEEKAKIFLAILGKRLGVAPRAGSSTPDRSPTTNPRSVADIDSPEALQRVRAWKQAQKKAGKTKGD